MPMLRTVECNVCGHSETEREYGAGWSNWLWIQGVALDGESHIWLCPSCMTKTMDFIDELKHGKINIVEK